MKKWKATLLCFVLASTFLTGCSKLQTQQPAAKTPVEMMVGQWTGQMDLTDSLNQAMAQNTVSGMRVDVTYHDIAVTMSLNINADGTMSTVVDEQSVAAMAEKVKEQTWDGVVKVMEAGYGMPIDEILEQNGMTEEQAKEDMFGGMDLSAQALGLQPTKGHWELVGDKLYTWQEGAEKNESEYMIIQLWENKLIWSDLVTDAQEEESGSLVVKEVLPIEFTK